MTKPSIEDERPTSPLIKILVPALSCLLTIVLIELALAVAYPIPFSIETNMYYEADPHTGFRLKPNGIGHFQMGISANANSMGLRDREFSLKKPAGTFRILVIGDSFTVGANVREEQTYAKALERKLRDAWGPNIEVVNSGVGGWNPPQYEAYYEHYGYQFEPDLILIGFFVGNDAFDPVEWLTAVLGHRVTKEAASSRLIRAKVLLYDHSNIARLLFNRGPVEENFVRKQCDEFSDWYLEVQKVRMPNHLRDSDERRKLGQDAIDRIRRIRDLASPIPVVVALLPDENQINPALQKRIIPPGELPRYDFRMPQSMLLETFGKLGIPTIDLLPAMLADRRCLYMNDTHWLPEGQEFAASIMFEQLKPVLSRMKMSRSGSAPPAAAAPN